MIKLSRKQRKVAKCRIAHGAKLIAWIMRKPVDVRRKTISRSIDKALPEWAKYQDAWTAIV